MSFKVEQLEREAYLERSEHYLGGDSWSTWKAAIAWQKQQMSRREKTLVIAAEQFCDADGFPIHAKSGHPIARALVPYQKENL